MKNKNSDNKLNNKKIVLIFSIFPFLIIIGSFMYSPKNFSGDDFSHLSVKGEKARAIKEAQRIFSEKRAAGFDMSDGPCLADEVIKGWAADIVHLPRQPIDDLSENQCQPFYQGKIKNLIELDTEGKFLRAY